MTTQVSWITLQTCFDEEQTKPGGNCHPHVVVRVLCVRPQEGASDFAANIGESRSLKSKLGWSHNP